MNKTQWWHNINGEQETNANERLVAMVKAVHFIEATVPVLQSVLVTGTVIDVAAN